MPLWFMTGDLHSAYSFLAFVMMTTSISIMYSWLYNSSGKKLIVVMFFHAMNNTAAPLLHFFTWNRGKTRKFILDLRCCKCDFWDYICLRSCQRIKADTTMRQSQFNFIMPTTKTMVHSITVMHWLIDSKLSYARRDHR